MYWVLNAFRILAHRNFTFDTLVVVVGYPLEAGGTHGHRVGRGRDDDSVLDQDELVGANVPARDQTSARNALQSNKPIRGHL